MLLLMLILTLIGGDRANVLTLDEFHEFRAKVDRGTPVSHQEVLKYCKMFEDSLTLDGYVHYSITIHAPFLFCIAPHAHT
jgi:hypothetical protein